MTWNTITGLTGGKQVDMGMYDPKIVDFALESDDGGTEYAFTGYGLKISATTINGNGNDGRTDASEYYTFSEDKQMSVDEILDNLIIIVVPDENPDGRTYNTRPNGNGFDLNRDASNQTQAETSNIARLICQWNPVTFIEFHGFTAQFLCEPCTPPHEPNLEYDLFVEQFLLGAEAFGNAALATMSVQHKDEFETKYQTYYTPLRDSYDAETGWDAWDDLSTNYTPSYAMLNCGSMGFTIETPSGGESSVRLLESGMYGLWQFLSDCKDTCYEAQLEFFRRAVNNEDHRDKMEQWYVDMSNQTLTEDTWRVPYAGNGKYFPEYYVLPVDAAAQRDPADAYAMAEFLIRNGVQVSRLTRDTAVDGVTYKAGSLVVDMYQAKRNYANCVLNQGYDASASGFPSLYSESVSSFPNMRGFDCAPIDTVGAFEGALEAVTEVQSASQSTGSGSIALLANNGTETVRTVNALLASGKTVGMVTEGANKGDFVVRASDLAAVEQEYALVITLTEQMPAARAISAPTLYLAGRHAAFGDDKVTSGYYTKWFADGYGFINYDNIHNNGTSNYDVMAYTKHMGFRVTDDPAKADVIVGSVALDSGTWGEAAVEAVKSGTPYIATGASTLDYLQTLIPGLTYEEKGQEALHRVTYPSDSLVTASQTGDGDHVIYTLNCAVLTGYPENAEVLIRAQEKDSFIAGCMVGGSMDNGVEAIAWTDGTMDITVFANSIVNRAHQQDDYLFASNAIFSEMLADEPLEFSAVTRGTLAQELYEREGKPTGGAAGFDDMAEDAAYADAVNWAASEGIMKGYSAEAFGPGDSLTREQLAVVLYRYAQKKGYELAQDGPALKDFTAGNAVSGWALEAMTWAVNTGVLTGKEDGTLAPQGAATADEVTQALERLAAAAG